MRILSFQSGLHDASAAAFEDYRLVAAVQEERLRREKGWGNDVPWLAIDEVLRIAGWSRNEVDVIAAIRGIFPTALFLVPAAARRLLYGAQAFGPRAARPRSVQRHHAQRHWRRPAVPQRPVSCRKRLSRRHRASLCQPSRGARAGGPVLYRLGRRADLYGRWCRRQRQLQHPQAPKRASSIVSLAATNGSKPNTHRATVWPRLMATPRRRLGFACGVTRANSPDCPRGASQGSREALGRHFRLGDDGLIACDFTSWRVMEKAHRGDLPGTEPRNDRGVDSAIGGGSDLGRGRALAVAD